MIVQYPDKRLNHPNIYVDLRHDVGVNIAEDIISKLTSTLTEEGGVGLSAPQIGEHSQVFVTKINGVYKSYINPNIVEYSEDALTDKEGCLSFDSRIVVTVKRSVSIDIEYNNLENETVTDTLTGFEARVFQHEYDHLKGLTLYDILDDRNKVNFMVADKIKQKMRKVYK